MISSTKQLRFGEALLCFMLLTAAVPPQAHATAAAPSLTTAMEQEVSARRFYQDSKRGWFWYEHRPVEEAPEEHPAAPATASISPEAVEKAALTIKEVPIEALWNMHPDDFQQLLNRQQKKAVQFPSEENVAMYLRTQDVARRKALAYTNTAQLVTQKSAIALGDVYPTSTAGSLARAQIQQEEIRRTIAGAQNDHAILFFEKDGCGYCEKQAQILAYFTERYGWEIKPIDIGQQPDLAARFNITATPTLLLIKQGEEQYMPISVGIIALSEMEQKLSQAVRFLRGDTSPESFTTHDFEKGSGLDPASILRQQSSR